ncbi:MAG TPA: diaminopimelate epimerase, partial [Paraburkholderia sp.]
MKLKFTKMHGAGNDFVVLDGYTTPLALTPERVRALADRHFGVGADQLLLVEKPTIEGVDFRYRIFNCDGGEVEHCGNGARCFVKFVRDRGLTGERRIRVQVQNGVIALALQENGEVVVDMGQPEFEPARVPFDASGLDGRREGNDTLWPLDVDGAMQWVSVVSMGNPHAVQIVDDVEAF